MTVSSLYRKSNLSPLPCSEELRVVQLTWTWMQSSIMEVRKWPSVVLLVANLTLLISSSGRSPWAAMAGALVSFSTTQRSDGLCAIFVQPYSNYACQEYVAQTQDGFLIGVQRISNQNIGGPTRGPVLLFHGILTGGDVWVINPPGEGLAFLLADAGYDVWVTNYRSTTFSYGHVLFKNSDKGFWDWSVDELAAQDLPSALELINSVTGQQVHLVSYSEGSQATLAAFSDGIAQKLVNKAVLLAPVSYLTSGPQLVEAASKVQLQKIYEALNIYQLSTRGPGGRELVDLLCRASSVKCYDDWFRIFSGYICCINSTRRAFIDQYETQATSVKNLDHYSQQVRSKTFAKFDYGAAGNQARYGQATPPAYEVRRYPMSAHTLFITSDLDSLANPTDVARLYRELPPGYQTAAVTHFGHLDFVFGYNANLFIYHTVLDYLLQSS